MNAAIGIQNVVKNFGSTKVLKNLSLEIKDGSFTILLGPSGCGKSTLLRIIAGLESPTSGEVSIGEECVTDYEPKDRHLAMVFQNYALYPHMTAYQNVEYGLKVKKIGKPERKKLVDAALAQVELTDQSHKLPAQMSGGQRQRVALARAIVKRPRAFLMDEPLSNLDAKLRNQMRFELIDLYQKLSTTFLYVTHDQVEAMSMGTHIVIMNQGEIMQQGSPRQIYEDPENLFVAQFIGSPPINIFRLEDYFIGVRPEKLSLKDRRTAGLCVPGRLHSAEQLGGETICHLETAPGNLSVKIPGSWEQTAGELFVSFEESALYVFDHNGSRVRDTGDALARLREHLKTIFIQPSSR